MSGERNWIRRALLACAALAALQATWTAQLLRVAHAQEQQEVQCPEDEGWLECRAAAGDRLAIYRLGRTAYETARETGDFSEALRVGRELVAQNDKNGERLLKMTHLQLSWGNHKDYVQAYVWMVEDQRKGMDYLDNLIRNLGNKMTPEQLTQAKELAAD